MYVLFYMLFFENAQICNFSQLEISTFQNITVLVTKAKFYYSFYVIKN